MTQERIGRANNEISNITPLGKNTCSFMRQETKVLTAYENSSSLVRNKWEDSLARENGTLYQRVKSQEQLYRDIDAHADTFLCGALLMYRAFQDEALQKGGVPIRISQTDYQEYLWDRQEKAPKIHEVITSTIADDIETQLEKFAEQQKRETTKVLQTREQSLLLSIFPYVSLLDDEKKEVLVEGMKAVYFPILYIQTRK